MKTPTVWRDVKKGEEPEPDVRVLVWDADSGEFFIATLEKAADGFDPAKDETIYVNEWCEGRTSIQREVEDDTRLWTTLPASPVVVGRLHGGGNIQESRGCPHNKPPDEPPERCKKVANCSGCSMG